jgi:hypothetical protein
MFGVGLHDMADRFKEVFALERLEKKPVSAHVVGVLEARLTSDLRAPTGDREDITLAKRVQAWNRLQGCRFIRN